MTDQNKSKLFLGFSLIFVSFVCIVVVLYFMGENNRKSQAKVSSLEVQLANVIAEKAATQLNAFDLELTRRDPINLDDVLARAESIYGKNELSRTEGVLWVDRKASLMMVTLGQANGLRQGSNLTVFEAKKKIGDVIVDSTFDLVAYVKPIGKTINDFDKNYYRVAK